MLQERLGEEVGSQYDKDLNSGDLNHKYICATALANDVSAIRLCERKNEAHQREAAQNNINLTVFKRWIVNPIWEFPGFPQREIPTRKQLIKQLKEAWDKSTTRPSLIFRGNEVNVWNWTKGSKGIIIAELYTAAARCKCVAAGAGAYGDEGGGLRHGEDKEDKGETCHREGETHNWDDCCSAAAPPPPPGPQPCILLRKRRITLM
jgi:hypothetical protein